MDDELDIYEDLDDFQEAENKKCKELEAVQSKCEAVQQEVANLQAENKVLSKKIKTMEVNFQNLLDTAKAEIKRKDAQITQLRKEKDDLCFRRKRPNNNQPPDVVERQEHKRFKREEPPATNPEIILNNNNENWIGLQKEDKQKHSKIEHKTQPQVVQHDNKKIHKQEKTFVASETSRHRPADACSTHDRDRDRDRNRDKDKNKDHRRHRSRSRDNKREAKGSKNSTHRHRTSSKDTKRNRHSRSRSPPRTASSHHKSTYPDSIKHIQSKERNKKHHIKTIKTDKHNKVRTLDTLFGSTPEKTEELSNSAVSEIVMEKLIANVDSSTSQEMYKPPAQAEHKIEKQKHEEMSEKSPQTIDEVDMYFINNVKDIQDAVEEVPNLEANNDKPTEPIDKNSRSVKPMKVLDNLKEPKAMETVIETAETVSEEICIDKEQRIPGLDLIDKDEETDDIGQVLSNEEIPELDFNAEEEIVIEDNAESETGSKEYDEKDVIEGDDESETVLNKKVEEEVIEGDVESDTVLNVNEEEIVPEDDNTETVFNENVEEEVVEDDDIESAVNYDQEVNKDANDVKIYEENQVNDEDPNTFNQENVNDDDAIDEEVNDENDDTTKEHIPGLDLIDDHNSDNDANELMETPPTANMNIDAEKETTEKVESSQPNEEDIPDGNLKEEKELANDEQEITDNVNNNQDIPQENPATKYEDIISNEMPQEVEAEYNEDCKPDEALNECENMTENVEITLECDKKSTNELTIEGHTEAKQLIEINSPETPDTSQMPTTPTIKSSNTPSSTLSTSQEESMITPKLPKRAMRGIQIIEDIRLPVKMDIKQMSVTVKEKLPLMDSNVQQLQLPDISVGQIVTINKSVSELSADTPIVMYVQPDSTKIDHNDDEDAVLEAVMNELILEKPQPSDLNESYPNLSLETDTIEMALEQLHHHSPIDGQPDETTVSSTSMKDPKPDLIKILTQTPNSKQQQMDLEKSRRGPSTVRIRIKSMNACSTNEGMSPECKKKLSLTPEKREKSPHKRRKLHESPKHKLITPDVVPATPPDEPMTIETSPQHVTLDETNISDSSLNQSADTSIVLKRCSMGNSDYQYEKVNDEVILRVTRRPRRRRPAAVAELNESVTTGTTDEKS